MVDELARVVAAELRALGDEGATPAEMQRSKAQMKAGLLMALESSSVRAEQMARNLLTHDRLVPAEELVQLVDAVTGDDIRAFAAKLATQAPTVTVVGSGRKSLTQAKSAAKLFAPSIAHLAPTGT
jgi:predicted Zn-dependent peptidase